MCEVTVYVGYAPFYQIQVVAFVIQVSIIKVTLLFFGNSFGMFVLLYEFGITRTAGGSRTVDRNHDRQRTFHCFDTTVDMPFHCDTAILFVYVQDFFGICDLSQT